MEKEINLVIGCDCDPDRPKYTNINYLTSRNPSKLSWKGIENLPDLKDSLKLVKDDHGHCVKFTWLLRSDKQMYDLYGDYAYPACRYKQMWMSFEGTGDEIGWHPHLTRWDEELGVWNQEISDGGWIEQCLRGGYSSLCRIFNGSIRSTRGGCHFQNNVTLKTLSSLKIRYDFSANPGQDTKALGRFKVINNYYDWDVTSGKPYYPSRTNYKRPAGRGEEPLPILEIPLSSFHSRWMNLLKALKIGLINEKSCVKFKDLLKLRGGAFVSPMITANPIIFGQFLRHFEKKKPGSDGIDYIATYFHPDEVLPNFKMTNLYTSYHFLLQNILKIKSLCKANNLSLRFVTCSELGSLLSENNP